MFHAIYLILKNRAKILTYSYNCVAKTVKRFVNAFRVEIHFSNTDDADDTDFILFLYLIDYIYLRHLRLKIFRFELPNHRTFGFGNEQAVCFGNSKSIVPRINVR